MSRKAKNYLRLRNLILRNLNNLNYLYLLRYANTFSSQLFVYLFCNLCGLIFWELQVGGCLISDLLVLSQ